MVFNSRILFKAALWAGASAALVACAHHGPTPTGETGPPSTPAYNAPPPPPSTAPYGEVQSRPSGPVAGSVRDFVVSAGDRVFFDVDQYSLTSTGRGILDMQAQWLQRHPQVSVRIEGNCDERGTREYNLALGSRRAEAVKAYLIERGVSPARIATISYGKERPFDPGSGDEAYAHNRNAHTALTAGAVGGVNDDGE